MSGSLTGTASIDAGRATQSRSPRCRHTLLTKPECHCPACLHEQIAAHAPGAAPVAHSQERAAA